MCRTSTKENKNIYVGMKNNAKEAVSKEIKEKLKSGLLGRNSVFALFSPSYLSSVFPISSVFPLFSLSSVLSHLSSLLSSLSLFLNIPLLFSLCVCFIYNEFMPLLILLSSILIHLIVCIFLPSYFLHLFIPPPCILFASPTPLFITHLITCL